MPFWESGIRGESIPAFKRAISCKAFMAFCEKELAIIVPANTPAATTTRPISSL